MRFLESTWCPVCLGIIILIMMVTSLLPHASTSLVKAFPEKNLYRENEEWVPPSANEIPSDSNGDLIRYGRELIANTSRYLGPEGIVAHCSNSMNCQNCHLEAGMQNFGNPFSAAFSSYPRYRERSGRVESITFRINECLKRSMNGKAVDSAGTEMKAMVAYINWVGKDVPRGIKPLGAGTEVLPFLQRPADPAKGKIVYVNYCQRCHGSNGEGLQNGERTGYTYPPLWGEQSYNVSAGMYRLSMLAGFIKNNMPQGTTWKDPVLTDEQAWDAAAFINSQQRPVKFFSYDYPAMNKKPFDYPFGPYTDGFSEQQHKYGPFVEMKKMR
ncbi:MAG TPA: c-type cytochrome [Flavisolibacter sp.]|nr:c-type cytochrome [Flavisolibacter sp.]